MRFHSTFSVGASLVHDAMRFAPDRLVLATGHAGGGVLLWDPLTGKQLWRARGHEDDIYNIGFGRTSRELVTGSNDGTCYLWDVPLPAQPR